MAASARVVEQAPQVGENSGLPSDPNHPELPFEPASEPNAAETAELPTVRQHPPSPPQNRFVQDFEPPSPPSPLFQSFGGPDPGMATQELERRPWWIFPLLGALALLVVSITMLVQPWKAPPKAAATAAPPAQDVEPFRPLGLFVDAKGAEWRVTWNQTATPLKNPRSVDLFVREGEEQNRVDLTPEQRQAASYAYRPKASDVMFRLEVTDAAGRVSAESFRVLRPSAPAPPKPVAPAVAAATAPKAIHKVAPEVPTSIKSRIRGSVPIDVRVKVDAKGHVTAATPVKKHSGLEGFLAQRAVSAAKQWRFTPAKKDGKAVPGSQTIHFVFDR